MNDEKDDFIGNVLKYLGNEVECGNCQRQPTSAKDMSSAIADYCIYTYERKIMGNKAKDNHTGTEPKENTGSDKRAMKEVAIDDDKGVTSEQLVGLEQRSVRQLYSDYINEIVSRAPSRLSIIN